MFDALSTLARPRLIVPALLVLITACTTTSGGGGDDDDDDGASSSSSGGSGASGGGSSGASGSSSGASGGSNGAPVAAPLSNSTFLYVKHVDTDHDTLMAWDAAADEQRVITDLTGDGSSGWEIAGYAISPDRRSIALASLYEPTQEDVDSNTLGRRIFTLASDGSGFKRLTPVWPNGSQGRRNWMLEVRDPSWSRDGNEIFYGFGEYWYEGTQLQGGSSIWSVAVSGETLPTEAVPVSNCSLTDPSVDPVTGKLAVSHSVCIDNAASGIWLHTVGGAAEHIVDTSVVDPDLEQVSWAKDGSGFLFVAQSNRTIGGSSQRVRGLFLYDGASKQVYDIAIPTDPNQHVRDATLAPDTSAAVYCMTTTRNDTTSYDLHLVDLTANPFTDTQITNDGKSCNPRW